MTEKDNAAMEARYGEWFNAFITHSNGNERQGAVMVLLLGRLKEKVPGAFAHKGEKPPVFLDLMCGPGDMTRHYKTALQKIGLENVKACGVELRDDHVAEWKRKMDAGDVVIQGNVADAKLDMGALQGEKPVAAFWGHGGYYLYQPKEGAEKGGDAELAQQPALSNAVTLMHKTLGPKGISVAVHKDTEWTDIAKQRFARLVESDTTEALHRIYASQSIRHSPITFECELKIPEITADIRRMLLADTMEDYGKMKSGDGKTVRQILEFLVHTPLEELGRAEYDKAHEANTSFAAFNQQKRKQYVATIEELAHRHNGAIPTYVDFVVSVSPQAEPDFAKAVLATARDVNNEVGKKIDMPDFLRVKREIESRVVGARVADTGKEQRMGA